MDGRLTWDVEDVGLDTQQVGRPGVGRDVDGHQPLGVEGRPAHEESDHHGHCRT